MWIEGIRFIGCVPFLIMQSGTCFYQSAFSESIMQHEHKFSFTLQNNEQFELGPGIE